MSALTTFFFRVPCRRQTTWSIIEWWEARRLIYNLAVGSAGLLSLATVALMVGLPPEPNQFHFAVDAVLMYGLLANVCYTLGPALDLLVHRTWGSGYGSVGPALFRYGFAFAMGVTLLPIPGALVAWVSRLLGL